MPPTTERRKSRRRKLAQLVYLEFGRENGGMVKDVSENGMRFHLMNSVTPGQSLRFAVNIDATRRLEGQATMVWTDPGGKSGGMSFTEISEESRQMLRAWLAAIDAPQPSAPAAAPAVTPRVAPTPPAPSPVPPAPVPQPAVDPVSFASRILSRTPAEAPTEVPKAVPKARAAPEHAPLQVPVEVPSEAPAAVSAAPSAKVSSAKASKASEDTPDVLPESPEAPRSVTREDWIRAARQDFSPGRTSGPAPAAAKAASAAAIEEKLQSVLTAIPGEIRSPEAKKFQEMAVRVDPLREFLRQPRDDSSSGHTPVEASMPAEIEEDFDTFDDTFDTPRRKGWTFSRVAFVLVLAAICGLGVAFAAIAYRQTIGESIIEFGRKITGDSRTNAPADAAPPSSQPAPAADSAKSTNQQEPASANVANSPNALADPSATSPGALPSALPPNSPANSPSSVLPTSPLTEAHPQNPQRSTNAQTELAARREVVPGKSKHLSADLASLWAAVENGDANAEVQLAYRYATGIGVEKNCDQARVLLEAAAKRGNELAAKRLVELSRVGCQ
jgi:PilZ domain